MNQQPSPSKLTPLGRLLSILLVAGLITAGVWMLRKDRGAAPDARLTPRSTHGNSKAASASAAVTTIAGCALKNSRGPSAAGESGACPSIQWLEPESATSPSAVNPVSCGARPTRARGASRRMRARASAEIAAASANPRVTE